MGAGLRTGWGVQRVRSAGEGQGTDPEHSRRAERPDQGNKEMQRGEGRGPEWLPPNSSLAGSSAAAPLPDILSAHSWSGGGGGGRTRHPFKVRAGNSISLNPQLASWSFLGHPDSGLYPGEKAGWGGMRTLRGGVGFTVLPPAPQPSPQVTGTGGPRAHRAFIWWQMGVAPAEK